MATENPNRDQQASDTCHLENNVFETVSVQERGGTLSISIPKDAARDIGLQKGDNVLISGREGDRSLELKPSATVLAGD